VGGICASQTAGRYCGEKSGAEKTAATSPFHPVRFLSFNSRYIRQYW
jgi:hypothetical protein